MPIWFLPKVSDGCTWQAHAFSKRRSYHSDKVFFLNPTTLFFFFIVPRNVYSKINWRVSVHTLKLAQCTWSRLENVVEPIISRMSFESWPRLDKWCRQWWCSSVCENCDGWNVFFFPYVSPPFFKKGGWRSQFIVCKTLKCGTIRSGSAASLSNPPSPSPPAPPISATTTTTHASE